MALVMHVGQHRCHQFAVEEAQRALGVDAPGGEDVAMLEHLLMGGQLSLYEVVQLMVVRADRELVHPQFVQAQHLHQHAVEVAELVLHHALLGTALQRLGQPCQPLVVRLDQRRQRVLQVVHGGGDHRGEIQPLVVVVHAPKTRMCSLR
jgi:hypothetical protein